MSFIFILYILVCLLAIVYFIRKGTKKAKLIEKTNKKRKAGFPKKKSLAITAHLFKDGYGEKTFKLKKGHKFHINADGLKEISAEWDYDFWQITSNKSEYAFEWLREDQNNNHVSTLNFWNGGDLSKSKKAISEDSALDTIQNSDWIPSLDTFLTKKNIQANKSVKKNSNSLKPVPNDEVKLGKHKISSSMQKDTKTKDIKLDNSRSKGFGN